MRQVMVKGYLEGMRGVEGAKNKQDNLDDSFEGKQKLVKEVI